MVEILGSPGWFQNRHNQNVELLKKYNLAPMPRSTTASELATMMIKYDKLQGPFYQRKVRLRIMKAKFILIFRDRSPILTS
jgi:hypothetical protein